MLRDILIATTVLGLAAFGFSFTETGRAFFARLVPDDGYLSRAEVEALFADDAILCFWPNADRKCLWAEVAQRTGDRFDVTLYGDEGVSTDGGGLLHTVSAARTGVWFDGDALCEDPDRPITPSGLGFYEDPAGAVRPGANVRLATLEEHAAFMTDFQDTGDAKVCFRFSEGPLTPVGQTYLQTLFIDGTVDETRDEFIVFPARTTVLLSPIPVE